MVSVLQRVVQHADHHVQTCPLQSNLSSVYLPNLPNPSSTAFTALRNSPHIFACLVVDQYDGRSSSSNDSIRCQIHINVRHLSLYFSYDLGSILLMNGVSGVTCISFHSTLYIAAVPRPQLTATAYAVFNT